MSSITEQLQALKVIPVIAIEQAEDIIPLGAALANNGLPVAEITFRSDAAVEAIRLLRKAYPEMLIGAGTVLNREQVMAAKEAGATFIVSPALTPIRSRLVRSSTSRSSPGSIAPAPLKQRWRWG